MNIKYLFNIPFVLAQQREVIDLYGPPSARLYGPPSSFPQTPLQKVLSWFTQYIPIGLLPFIPLLLIILLSLGIFTLIRKKKNASKIS